MTNVQRILAVGLGGEQDVVLVRQRARQVSNLLGFSQQDQVRIATAVSEVARGACQAGFGGRASFLIRDVVRRQYLEVTISAGAGAQGRLPDDAAVTAHRLMDECEVEQGTITMRKLLPPQPWVGAGRLSELAAQLAKDSPVANTYNELQLQNRELVTTLAELRERQEDLLSLTRELEDTNRGIVALYAEIEDKAERLRRADEMKSRFLSNTSHELRTPLSSIRALAKLLLHPACVLLALWLMPSVPVPLRLAGVLFAAMPMLSIYPLVAMKHGQEGRSAAILLVATIAAFVTISGWMWGLQQLPGWQVG